MVDKIREPVRISLADLEKPESLHDKLQEAFGTDSLGIIILDGLPQRFHELRTEVLINATRLARLPSDQLARLEDNRSKYLVGWSRGREMFNGQPDMQKGSFYYNPTHDKGTVGQHPEYETPNLWPELPNFKNSAEELGQMIVSIATRVARACDANVLSRTSDVGINLEDTIRHSQTCKARLLHYFPVSGTTEWCGEHLDHGCLTGLTSAMYHDEADPTREIASPDSTAGLYIRDRTNTVVKVNIPRDCLAFQTGSALEVMTEGRIKAVPHFVRGCSAPNISRNTLAVFMQPNLDSMVGETRFKDFARVIVDSNTV